MSRIYLLTLLAALFLLVLSLTRLRLRLYYRRRGKDDEVALEFSIWRGLLCYKLEIPVVEMKVKKAKPKPRPLHRPLFWPVPRPVFKIKTEVEGKGGRPITEEKKKIRVPGPVRMMKIISNYILLVKKYKTAIVYLLSRVHLLRFHWKTELGTGDPAQTGFLTGLAWGVKGFILTAVYRLLSPGGARPSVAVTPNFEKACFSTTLDCIFEVRIGYIISTGFKALIIKFK